MPISEQSSPKHSSGYNLEVEKGEAILDLGKSETFAVAPVEIEV